MGFLFGLMAFDCLVGVKRDRMDGGFLTPLVVIYAIFKLPEIEMFILNEFTEHKQLITMLIIALTILLPLYKYASENFTYYIMPRLLYGVFSYINFIIAIALMVIISNNLGSYPASLIFDAPAINVYADSSGVIGSFFASIFYWIVKTIDLIVVVALVPAIQITLIVSFKKIFNIKTSKNTNKK